MLDTQTVPCDLCKGTEALPLYTLNDSWYGLAGEFVLRRCRRCGLMYLSPRPTPEAMPAYYPLAYDNYRPPIEDERWALMRWMRRRKLIQRRRLIERYSGQTSGRLLDIGCATGLFLHEMALAGWEVMGIEPIAAGADFARRRFGLNVFQGFLGQAPCAPASFDVVTFWDVLEHTFSPSQELAHAARLLRAGGLLTLSVPNWDSFDRRLFGPHWQGLDAPRHLYVFTRHTLTALLNQAGFQVIKWDCFMPGYFSFIMSLERWLQDVRPGLSSLARRLFDLPGLRLPFEPWFALTNRLGRGPTLAVFARRQTV